MKNPISQARMKNPISQAQMKNPRSWEKTQGVVTLIIGTVWTDDHKLLQESKLSVRHPSKTHARPTSNFNNTTS